MLRTLSKSSIIRTCTALAVCLSLGSCSAHRETIDPQFDLGKPQKPLLDDDTKVLGKDQIEPIITVPIGDEVLVPQPLEKSDPLPNITIENFSAVDATILETFRVLLLDEGIPVSIDPRIEDVRVNIFDLSGYLKDVMDRISETSGVYYTYKNGLLTIRPTRTFVVKLPPVPFPAIADDSVGGPDSITTEVFDEVADTLTNFGATNVKVDRFSRLLSFTANRMAYDNIATYLDKMKYSRVMIVYETYVFEVTLNDENNKGIDWDAFNLSLDGNSTPIDFTLGGGVSLDDATNPLTFGATYEGSRLNINTVVTFLESQGSVEIISKPTVAMVSGTSARFEVGQSQRYVSETETSIEEGIRSVTFTTEDLDTGFLLRIAGDYIDETVFTRIELEISNLLGFERAGTTGLNDNEPTADDPDTPDVDESETGTDQSSVAIQLPTTSSRRLQNQIRSRPGDAILLAGINQSRDSRTDSGIPKVLGVFPLQTQDNQLIERTEVVMIMIPRVIKFEPRNSKDKETILPAKANNDGVNTLLENQVNPDADLGDQFGVGAMPSLDDALDPEIFLQEVPEARPEKMKAEPSLSPPVIEDPLNRDIGQDPAHQDFQYFRRDGSL